MTTQHTPGRLKIGRIDHESQHVEIDAESTRAHLDCYPWEHLATCYGEEGNPERGSAVMEANARRLVACWNACEGLTTANLENIEMMGETLAGRFAAFHASERELMDTRDELLEALKDLAQSIVWKEFGECRGFSDSMPLPVITAVEKARAAIAKATGEQE